MSTRVPRYMTISVAMVLFAGIFVRIVSGQPQDEGVRYKTKHLKEHRGTLIKNPSQDKKVEEDVIQIGSESETQLQTNTDQENFALQPYMTAIKPVSVNRYRLAMSKAQTHYDVFRMFIPEELSEEIVDNIMMTMTTLPIGLTVGRTSIGDHDTVRITPEQWSQWEETLKETRSSECGRPVPEVIRVRNVLGGGDEEYTPSCVLSYRCRRDSGCCLHEFQECTAIKSEQTLKTVLVAKSDSADNQIHFENVMVREFNVTNDTECGCTTIVTPTHIPCPHPFEYDINIQRCRCRDASFKQTCRKIQKGDGMMTPSTIKCIQQGRCRPLDNCYYGDYDMSLNQCPKDQSGSGIEPPNVRKQQRRPHRG